ncbi:hypothetical protein Acsp06_43910 [Actinomycetospora sp. NBRC 106375]|nr:hypothetical protein Acsp06_43910 [Actinomycetospora sp. NBRC 106375]
MRLSAIPHNDLWRRGPPWRSLEGDNQTDVAQGPRPPMSLARLSGAVLLELSGEQVWVGAQQGDSHAARRARRRHGPASAGRPDHAGQRRLARQGSARRAPTVVETVAALVAVSRRGWMRQVGIRASGLSLTRPD